MDEDECVRARNALVLDQAREAGLLGPRKDARIAGRISAALLGAAKKRTRAVSDTELLEIALSRLVLEDDSVTDSCAAKGRFPRAWTSSFDLDTALFLLKPQQRITCKSPRPDEQLPWVEDAPLIAGPLLLDATAFRLRKMPENQGHERKFLHDALLYLQARKLGCAVLTRNIGDFDLLNQLLPSGQILLYRRTSI